MSQRREVLRAAVKSRMAVVQSEAYVRALDKLTARGKDVALLISWGYTTREIAHHLGITPKTVENHRGQVHQRVGVSSPALLARIIEQYILLTPPHYTPGQFEWNIGGSPETPPV